MQEVLSRGEVEEIFLASQKCDEQALSYNIFSEALDQVGRLCAQKLMEEANSPPGKQVPELRKAAVFQKLKCTQWLIAGLKSRSWASVRIRGSEATSASPRIAACSTRSTSKHATATATVLPEISPRGKAAQAGTRQPSLHKDSLKVQAQARRYELASKLSKDAFQTQKNRTLARQARGNERILTLQEHERAHWPQKRHAFQAAVADLKSAVTTRYAKAFGAMWGTVQEVASTLKTQEDDMCESELSLEAAAAFSHLDRRTFCSADLWCPTKKGREWLERRGDLDPPYDTPRATAGTLRTGGPLPQLTSASSPLSPLATHQAATMGRPTKGEGPGEGMLSKAAKFSPNHAAAAGPSKLANSCGTKVSKHSSLKLREFSAALALETAGGSGSKQGKEALGLGAGLSHAQLLEPAPAPAGLRKHQLNHECVAVRVQIAAITIVDEWQRIELARSPRTAQHPYQSRNPRDIDIPTRDPQPPSAVCWVATSPKL